MPELDKFQELTDINFDGQDPHYAVCHFSQGYSANGCHNALMFKSENVKVNSELLKTLATVIPETELIKISAMNKRDLLEDAIVDNLRSSMSSNGEYIWASVADYNDTVVVFRFQEKLWAADYEETEQGLVTIKADSIILANHMDLYTNSETGEELIKSTQQIEEGNGPEPEGEDSSDVEGDTKGEDTTEVSPESEDEEIMSDEVTVVETTQEEINKAAQELAKSMFDELIKAQELEKQTNDTTEILKAVEFIAEDSLETIVKSVLASDASVEILKALTDAQDAVTAARAEAEEIKKEFGERQDSTSTKPVIEKGNHEAKIAEWVANQKAKKA